MSMTKNISWANDGAYFVSSVVIEMVEGYRECIVFQELSAYSQV